MRSYFIRFILVLLLGSFYFEGVLAQIGIGTDTPAPSAALELDTREGGLLIPRLTTAQRDVVKSPAEGLMIFNSTTERLNFWNGSAWMEIPATFISSTLGDTEYNLGLAVNSTGALPAASAILDISSSQKGLLLPRGTEESFSSPTEGLLFYSPASKSVVFHNGTSWRSTCRSQVSNTIDSATGDSEGLLIGTGTGAHPSAMLEINVTGKGLLIPRLSNAQRDELKPAIGLIIFNRTTAVKRLEFYTSSGWYAADFNSVSISSITGSATNWESRTGVYSVVNQAGVTFNWVVPSDWVINSGQGTNQITVTYGKESGSVNVYGTNGCGSSPTVGLNVAIKRAFITTWNTNYSGAGTTSQIRIGMRSGGYNFFITWGDGTSQTYSVPANTNTSHYLLHTYPAPGIYTVKITGDFASLIGMNGTPNRLVSIDQWGDIAWGVSNISEVAHAGSLASSYQSCFNLTILATDVPDLSHIDVESGLGLNLRSMFENATGLNAANLKYWDVSKVTNMRNMFKRTFSFNQDISTWDVSKVTNMIEMFHLASAFNQDLSGWCVSLIPSESTDFDTGADAWVLPRPVWGTCP